MGRPHGVQGAIDMQRGHRITHLPSLEMPARFDPSGVPCVDSGDAQLRATSSRRRHPRSLPGLAPTSILATVEAVAEHGASNWLIWGSDGDRPVMFTVAASAAAEMMASIASGEMATAIIEPWQLVLERLD
jgi:hypothetical protein